VVSAEKLCIDDEEARSQCDGNDQECVRWQSPHARDSLLASFRALSKTT
jgi:hypothetical protein